MKFQSNLGGHKYTILGGIISAILIISLISVSSGEESFVISPSSVSIAAHSGDFIETWLTIRNNLSRDVDARVEGLDGKILDVLPSVDKIRINIPPKDEKVIRVGGYIPKTSKEGIYTGEIILKIDQAERRIPITIEIPVYIENISLALKVYPTKSEIAPGHILYIQSDITNSGKRTVSAEIELKVIDPDTGRVVFKKSSNITVEAVLGIITELNIPESIEQKEYNIEGTLYVEKRIVSSAESRVTIKRTFSDAISQVLSEFTPAKIQLIILLFIMSIPVYLYYLYYKREKIRRKRYLESIKFDTLPQPGSRSGFIGRIAETSVTAFLDLNTLQTHTLIAGATGCGKTVVAQSIAEEALLKEKSVLVFDPTAQWSGFLRANKDKRMLRLYGKFHMKKENSMPFKGNVYVITDSGRRIDIERFTKPGEITVFYLKNMDTMEMEIFISNVINDINQSNPQESQELKTLLIFDEIHRMLPKFGGSGKGILNIEMATREFRKWGIGVVLVSQVLKDFTSVIQANIGTEIQMQTRYEDDLVRIKTKYGEDIYKSVVKANTGSGMFQNSEYNMGMPYFISFRPLLHNPDRLSNEELQLYEKYNSQIDELIRGFKEIKNSGIDVFDLELELNLAQDSIKEGAFGIVDMYMTSLGTRIDEYYNRMQNKQIAPEELAIRSEWDVRKEEEIKSYENELRILIEKEKKKLEEKERLEREREEGEKRRIAGEKKRLEEEEKGEKEEMEKKQETLKSESQVLDLLRGYEKEIAIREDVRAKEEEKLKIKGEELKKKREEEEKRLEEEKRKRLEEEKRIADEAQKKKEFLEREAQRVDERGEEITADKQMIVELDKDIVSREQKLVENIKAGIQEEIGKKQSIREELISEKNRIRQEELKKEELELSKKLEEERRERSREGKEKRKEFKGEKDRLQTELNRIKERWKDILDKERKMRDKEEELEQKMREWEIRVNEERKKIETGIEVKEGWEDFELLEREWEMMDQWDKDRKKLEEELNEIRNELKMQKGLRYEEEREFTGKEEELRKLKEEAGIKEETREELAEGKFEVGLGKITPGEEQKLKEKEKELMQELEEWDVKITEEEKRMEGMETKGEDWGDFELMEKEWGRMDKLRDERRRIEEELNDVRKRLRSNNEKTYF